MPEPETTQQVTARHAPLLRRPVGSAIGWLVAECDCGWTSEQTCSQLKAIEFYGDHRAEVAMCSTA